MPPSTDLLRRSWREFMAYDIERSTPLWTRLAWSGVFAAGMALVFTLLSFLMLPPGDDGWRRADRWLLVYRLNFVVSLTISVCILALFALALRVVGARRLRLASHGRRSVFFAGIPLLGVAIGWPLGLRLMGLDFVRAFGLGQLDALLRSLVLCLLISFVFHLVFSARARQMEAEKRATEAQLRLLQAQMEPHFLFNTLANVQSLIGHDPSRASEMLESFTDYLRASLGRLRVQDGSVQDELQLAQAYLALLARRMEDRLNYRIEADPTARAARLPPLALQPLVENAVRHGLEPKIEGGTVVLQATVTDGRLRISVRDDGLGLDAPVRPRGQAGAGMALQNLRERLHARHGDRASLTLRAGHPGTEAVLDLPYEPA